MCARAGCTASTVETTRIPVLHVIALHNHGQVLLQFLVQQDMTWESLDWPLDGSEESQYRTVFMSVRLEAERT